MGPELRARGLSCHGVPQAPVMEPKGTNGLRKRLRRSLTWGYPPNPQPGPPGRFATLPGTDDGSSMLA